MSTTLGQLNPDSDSFSAYVERVFTVNDISGDKRAADFLNFIGARAYELLQPPHPYTSTDVEVQ